RDVESAHYLPLELLSHRARRRQGRGWAGRRSIRDHGVRGNRLLEDARGLVLLLGLDGAGQGHTERRTEGKRQHASQRDPPDPRCPLRALPSTHQVTGLLAVIWRPQEVRTLVFPMFPASQPLSVHVPFIASLLSAPG